MKEFLARLMVGLGLMAPLLFGLLGAADLATEGKAVFMKRCRMCHGADGQGNPAMARMLGVEFKPLDSEYVQKKTDEEFKELFTKGKGKMAPVRGITEDEIPRVIAYVRSLAKKEQ